MRPNPCICKVCGHNMGRSRVKDGRVRCNSCKTVFTITIRPIHKPSEASNADGKSLPSGESQALKGCNV